MLTQILMPNPSQYNLIKTQSPFSSKHIISRCSSSIIELVKMAGTSPQKSFRIKHDDDDKFLSKLLSKETSKCNPSFRVYYGDVSSAVPFTWETRPGTPKHVSSLNSHTPPLTPPPSFSYKLNNSSSKTSRSKLLFHNLLRRLNPKKHQFATPNSRSSASSLSSLSYSSSSNSSYSDPANYVRKRRRFSSWGSYDDRALMDDRRATSNTCFGSGNYSAVIVKKALLSIVGRGSAAA